MPDGPIIIATRGSPLALAQSNMVAAEGRRLFPGLSFELRIIKTTGDKLQTASLAQGNGGLPKGLFTKELEVALLANEADLAVHSLKDLPTELPEGLFLAATLPRADVRDVLIYRHKSRAEGSLRGLKSGATLKDFPEGATIATSSTRRKEQLLAARPDFNVVEIRGNVATRMKKVAEHEELDGTLLALAGISRLNYTLSKDGKILGKDVPQQLRASILDLDVMLPAVGQGAIGIETRVNDQRISQICERLNHLDTFQCVTAERAFLAGVGGGCQSPVAAYGQILDGKISLRAVSFANGSMRQAEGMLPVKEAGKLGRQLAEELR
jgi:hydroxymethylbilane synthase